MRCTNDVPLDALVGRLIAFELDNFENYSPNLSAPDFAFKAKLNDQQIEDVATYVLQQAEKGWS